MPHVLTLHEDYDAEADKVRWRLYMHFEVPGITGEITDKRHVGSLTLDVGEYQVLGATLLLGADATRACRPEAPLLLIEQPDAEHVREQFHAKAIADKAAEDASDE